MPSWRRGWRRVANRRRPYYRHRADQFPAPRGASPRRLAAFLFADIRGYTRFTERHGAEAASRLAAAFFSLAGEVASAHGGRLRGSWGDQVLVEFDSPRDAVRAAVELRRCSIDAAVADPSRPLLLGVGLDIGEEAAFAAGSSSGGLNVAARLCARAAPGQVLATAQLTRTAGAVAGVTFADHGRVRLKGLDEPLRVRLVRPNAAPDAERDRGFDRLVRREAVRAGPRPRAWIAGLTVAALLLGLTALG